MIEFPLLGILVQVLSHAVKKAAKLNIVHGAEAESLSISTCRVAAHASGLGQRDHRRHTCVAGQCVPTAMVYTWTSV